MNLEQFLNELSLLKHLNWHITEDPDKGRFHEHYFIRSEDDLCPLVKVAKAKGIMENPANNDWQELARKLGIDENLSWRIVWASDIKYKIGRNEVIREKILDALDLKELELV